MALGIGAAIIGSVISGLFGSRAAKKAAEIQSGAAQNAIDAQLTMFGIGAGYGEKYIKGSSKAPKYLRKKLKKLDKLTGKLNTRLNAFAEKNNLFKPISFTQEELENTPGYQFTMNEGLKSTQRGYAARGLGSSGAAMKGAARFSTGLANATYQSLFQMEQANRQQFYDRKSNQLQGIYDRRAANYGLEADALFTNKEIGASTAGSLIEGANRVGTGIANSYTNQGNAQAASLVATGRAIGGIFSDAAAFGAANKSVNALFGNTGGSSGSGAGLY